MHHNICTIETQIMQGYISHRADENEYGSILYGSSSYSYYNYNGQYNDLVANQSIFFFACPRILIESLPPAGSGVSPLLAFNLHNFDNGCNCLEKRERDSKKNKGTTTGPNSSGTVTDIPPSYKSPNQTSLAHYYVFTDCGDILLVEDFSDSNSCINNWDKFELAIIENTTGPVQKCIYYGPDSRKWKHQ